MAFFSQAELDVLFPPERSDAFFDALYGGAEEGAYDIHLVFHAHEEPVLRLVFELRQRPGHCLACNLTRGLPQVFERHPVINLRGLVEALGKAVGWPVESLWWNLGQTEMRTPELYCIPLAIMRHDGTGPEAGPGAGKAGRP